MGKPLKGQLKIEVPPAPGAVGRWTSDDEYAAYAREFGYPAAERQRKLAEQLGLCNCGEQAKQDKAADADGRTSKRIPGHMHKSGCPAFRPIPKTQTRISAEEQERRLNEGRS